MNTKSFYQFCTFLAEAAPALPPPPPGGDPAGGADPTGGMPPPGGDPAAAGGMPPMPGDPSAGGMGAQATPVPVKTIPVADVWKVLRRISEEPQYDSFFSGISVENRVPAKKVNNTKTYKSLST